MRSVREIHETRKNQFLGNFGAGNLGNECTLQAVIEQILRRWLDAQLLCFCANPQDVRTRHNIAAFPSDTVDCHRKVWLTQAGSPGADLPNCFQADTSRAGSLGQEPARGQPHGHAHRCRNGNRLGPRVRAAGLAL